MGAGFPATATRTSYTPVKQSASSVGPARGFSPAFTAPQNKRIPCGGLYSFQNICTHSSLKGKAHTVGDLRDTGLSFP